MVEDQKSDRRREEGVVPPPPEKSEESCRENTDLNEHAGGKGALKKAGTGRRASWVKWRTAARLRRYSLFFGLVGSF